MNAWPWWSCWLLLLGCQPVAPPPHAAAPPAPNPLDYLFRPDDPTAWVSDTLGADAIAQLREGDILLRRGFGGYSGYIAAVLDERYPVTHCGWVQASPLGWQVLHAMSSDQRSGIIVEPLADYLKQSQCGSLVLLRPRCTAAQRQAALAYAQAKAQQGIPFDAAFDDRDSSALYCAELLRDAFRHATGEDWLPRRCIRPPLDVLHLDNFFDRQRFEVIWNHWDSIPHPAANRFAS